MPEKKHSAIFVVGYNAVVLSCYHVEWRAGVPPQEGIKVSEIYGRMLLQYSELYMTKKGYTNGWTDFSRQLMIMNDQATHQHH